MRRERAACADFLVALAYFDRRRGWERLGHASLFSFLTRELGLSSGAAQLRLSAARLLPRHPAVEEALRAGRLCLSAVGQLARVLTPENEAEVLPRFFGLSAREAQEVVAAIRPDPTPPRREVVTPVLAAPPAPALPVAPRPADAAQASVEVRPTADPLHTCEVASPVRVQAPPATVEPLTADLRRLHLTVSAGLLEKVRKAKAGLSHALPGATTEQVLERALDLLLERQARAKALVRRPRSEAARERAPAATPAPASTPIPTPIPTPTLVAPPSSSPSPQPSAPAGERELNAMTTPSSPLAINSLATDPRAISAAIERAVRLRDGDRCAFPLDAGGVCGSTWQVELDHVLPVALGGQATVANLRCACRRHNRLAAEEALGARARDGARRRRPRRGRR